MSLLLASLAVAASIQYVLAPPPHWVTASIVATVALAGVLRYVA